jgi:hypothetical protein
LAAQSARLRCAMPPYRTPSDDSLNLLRHKFCYGLILLSRHGRTQPAAGIEQNEMP